MSENKITFPVKLASNNPQSFGIVDATEVSGHKSVKTLSDLYAISDPVLSILKDGSDAIGQEWFVVSEDCKYRLDNWANRKSVAGWTKLPKQELVNTKQSVSEKDQPSGYAGLDSNGKLPIEKTYGTTATVVGVGTYESLPVTGSSGVIYYVSNTSAQYKWSGSAYIDITNGADNAKKNETSIFDCSNGTSTKYYSSLSAAINIVPPVYRTSNRIISYLSTENATTTAVNYQYHGIDSTTWTNLTKWERVPNKSDLSKLEQEQIQGGVYDVSSHNDGAVFESLSTLLGSANLSTLIPTSVRRGGMNIRFIQGSVPNSEKNYVQYMLIADEFTAEVTMWQYMGTELVLHQLSNYTNGENSYIALNGDYPIAGNGWSVQEYNITEQGFDYKIIYSFSNSAVAGYELLYRGGIVEVGKNPKSNTLVIDAKNKLIDKIRVQSKNGNENTKLFPVKYITSEIKSEINEISDSLSTLFSGLHLPYRYATNNIKDYSLISTNKDIIDFIDKGGIIKYLVLRGTLGETITIYNVSVVDGVLQNNEIIKTVQLTQELLDTSIGSNTFVIEVNSNVALAVNAAFYNNYLDGGCNYISVGKSYHNGSCSLGYISESITQLAYKAAYQKSKEEEEEEEEDVSKNLVESYTPCNAGQFYHYLTGQLNKTAGYSSYLIEDVTGIKKVRFVGRVGYSKLAAISFFDKNGTNLGYVEWGIDAVSVRTVDTGKIDLPEGTAKIVFGAYGNSFSGVVYRDAPNVDSVELLQNYPIEYVLAYHYKFVVSTIDDFLLSGFDSTYTSEENDAYAIHQKFFLSYRRKHVWKVSVGNNSILTFGTTNSPTAINMSSRFSKFVWNTSTNKLQCYDNSNAAWKELVTEQIVQGDDYIISLEQEDYRQTIKITKYSSLQEIVKFVIDGTPLMSITAKTIGYPYIQINSGTCKLKEYQTYLMSNADIVFIGDSITECGYRQNTYAAQLISDKFKNRGCILAVGGATIDMLNLLWYSELPFMKPKYISLLAGTNNTITSSNIEYWKQQANSINAKLIVNCVPVTFDPSKRPWAAKNETILASGLLGARFDLATAFNNYPNDGYNSALFESDGIHPNAAGQFAMYNRFLHDVKII